MKYYRTLKTALRGLRRNVLRAALTTLGIVIGVAAVIAMMEIGNGSSVAIQRTIASMGANNLMILPGTAASGGVSFGAGSVMTLTPQDADFLAQNYVQLRGFQQQIVIAQQNLQAQQHTADLTRQRLQAGFVSSLDVANAEAQVATTRAQIPGLETSARQAIYALSVLLARPPADLLHELSDTQPLPVTPPVIPVGLPSDLLRHRPDVRQAEAQVHAATAQIGVATADLFPKFSLTGAVSWQSNLLQNWFSKANFSSSLGPTLQWAIFQGGSVVSNIHVQEALRDQSFLTYRKTVLTAFQDVENALIAFANEWEHRQALTDAVTANRKAVGLAALLYTQGQTDFLSLLDAQGSLYAAEDALVQSTSTTATDLIALYKALGGGWEIDAS